MKYQVRYIDIQNVCKYVIQVHVFFIHTLFEDVCVCTSLPILGSLEIRPGTPWLPISGPTYTLTVLLHAMGALQYTYKRTEGDPAYGA